MYVDSHMLLLIKQLQEFEKAVTQRDTLIEDLMFSLQHALSARDNLVSQLNAMNAMEIPCKDNAGASVGESLEEKVRKLRFL